MEWVALAGFAVNVIVLIIGAVWMIGKINTQTAVLIEAVNNLNETTKSTREWLGSVDKKVDDHDVRVAVLESKLK